jgi:hypothetical protein
LAESALLHAPSPVSASAPRNIHASLASKAENILQWDDREERPRRHHGIDKTPMYFVICWANLEITGGSGAVLVSIRTGLAQIVHQPRVVSLSCVPVKAATVLS